jgi:methylase of polypeptide subunit release factors
LGTGLGLLGLNCLFKLQPKQYIFTDCHSEVIAQLKKNLDYNYLESIKECHDNKVFVEELDWCHFEKSNLLTNVTFSFDVLLASGIIKKFNLFFEF